MNFWENITGSDLTREWKSFEDRAKALPADHRVAWEAIKVHLSPHSDFTGRSLMPLLDCALALLEETAADGQGAREVLGDDIAGFCAALAGDPGGRSHRDRWREQLNSNVAWKLNRLGD